MGEVPADQAGRRRPSPFSVTLGEAPGSVVATGEIDLATVDRFAAAIARAEQDAEDRVVLDLRAVTFVDSSGLRAMLEAYRRGLGDGRRVAVVCEPGPVRRLLEITGSTTVIEVLDAPPGRD